MGRIRAFFRQKYIKNTFIIVLICATIGLLIYQGLWATRLSLNKHTKDLTWYGIDGTFHPQDKRLDCQQRVNYINKEDTHLFNIYFHIYPNAFKYEDKAVFPQEYMTRAYPNGFSPGSIEFKDILIDGAPTQFSIEGYSDDILMITLKEALMPQDTMEIWMEYSIELPNSPGRFGYYDNTFNMGNWYPILCVYDEKGWNLEPYHSTGDPFYSNVSNYKVSITAPKEYIIASTGEVMNIVKEGQENTWELQAQAVRDFAWVASDKFKMSSLEIGDTMVYSYYYDDVNEGQKALEFGVAALETFNRLFGRYPYKNLSIVQTDFFIGGMEYPRLVMIDGNLYESQQEDWLEIVTVHEVAHQWWYGIVGNDQVHEAWLDEALTEYSTILYYGQFYDKEKEESKYKELITMGRYGLFKIYYSHEDIDETIHKPLYEFEDWLVYDSLVYGKGSMMIHDMRQRMGDELFFETFRKYFEDNQFKNVKSKDLLKACEDITGHSWDEFFEEWLYDK